jgi:drug/metabolite transporter (DMT)-like permease
MGGKPSGLPWPRLLLLVCGAGLPFGWLAMSGTRFAPTAHMGVLMAGASPLIAAALAWVLWRERPDRARALGLALMLVGVLLLAGKSLTQWSTATWRGDLLFLAAATLWAGYTLGFRGSGLTPWQAAAVVNAASLLAVAAWVLLRGGTALSSVPPSALLWQALWQGLLAGALGLWTYSVAIARLGAAAAAAFGALAPVVSALGGWWWLGDALTGLDALAIAAAVVGVLLASGALQALRQNRAHADKPP